MVAATAEQTFALAESIPDRLEDYETRLKAASFIGTCLTDREAQVVYRAETLRPIESLHDAIKLAAETGDENAYNMVRANVATDVIERTIKAGHVMEVDLHVDEAGRIQQFGQYMETVQANSLRRMAEVSPQMLARTKAETLNTFRLQEAYDQGLLDDSSFVVISRAPDDMTTQEAADAGFFTDTMSMALQVTSVKHGRLVTESAFIAGVQEPGADRHDAQMVHRLGEWLGIDLRNLSATELLGTPLRVNNLLLPNGAIDLVRVCDSVTGGFFGRSKPHEDYLTYRQQCRDREAFLQPKVDSIVAELITEAPLIRDRVHATERLHKISEKHMVQQAMFDRDIDPRVFGTEAATHIEAGRRYFEQGLVNEGLRETRRAERTAISSSCPTGSQLALMEGGEDEESTKETDELGDCEFVSKKCPKCGTKNVKTVISRGKISGACGCTAKLK